MPPIVGMIVSAKQATLTELQTVYGLQDCYTLAEIVLVDNHNRAAVSKANANHH